ncbi:MAG: hypothetical protein WCQ90_14640 [Deltaproteobacteria bacterium]
MKQANDAGKTETKPRIRHPKSLRYRITIPFTLVVVLAVLSPGFIAVREPFSLVSGHGIYYAL